MISDIAIQAFITLPEFIQRHLGWYIFGTIVVLGLFVLGLSDVMRFSAKRVWAISSVNFAESIRRRVLWITPLAILAIIVITQLQKPIDAQDAIRQTTKVALFTTGTLVTLVTIILACTNLPKEIENRVIFTVVTKPATRLEIIVGKVLGFSRVSAAILLIMGLFTWGYLHVRAWGLQRQLSAQLAEGVVAEINRPIYEHYATAGLLHAKRLAEPRSMGIHTRLPHPDDPRRWVSGDFEQEIRVPIHARPEQLYPPGHQTPAHGLVLLFEMDYEQRPLTDAELWDQQIELSDDFEVGPLGPGIEPAAPQRDEQEEAARRMPAPRVQISILDHNGFSLVRNEEINQGRPVELPPLDSNEPAEAFIPDSAAATIAAHLHNHGRVIIQMLPATAGVEYALVMQPQRANIPAGVSLLVPGTNQWILPTYLPEFRGRTGRWGQQIRGGTEPRRPIAVFHFRDAAVHGRAGEQIAMELPRVGVERDAGADVEEDDQPTEVSLTILNRNGATAERTVHPENNRATHFTVPFEAVEGGNFDVIVRCMTPGHFIGVLADESMVLVAGQNSFAFNLVKSLAILWLLSVLVIVVSIFCSTFLSWPIAVVLTTVILLGHYGVQRLGDDGPGLGARVAVDLGFQDPTQARVVSESVEVLNRALHLFGAVLPDISRFGATEEIERGINISLSRLVEAFTVAFGFGIPMMVLGYLFLRNKEVAP